MTPSADTPITAALLAYGMSGKLFHAPFLAAHPGFALRAVVERSQQRMAADYPGVKSYPSTEALLANPAIELVVVNTPNDTHYDLARQALLAGKHVLVEKPVATTVAQWQELGALARQQGRQLLAYQNRRWDTDFGAVRRVVESGQLGRLIEVHFRFDRFRPVLHTKVFKEDGRPGSGLLFDLGPHLLDQVISLFGKPLSFEKTLGSYRHGSQVPDFFDFHLHYPKGLNVWVTSSLLVADPGPAFIVHGTQGSYQKDRTDPQESQLLAGVLPTDPAYGREQPGQEGRLTLADPAGHNRTLPPVADAAAPANYLGLFEAVYQAIRHGQPYPVTDEELTWQLALLAAEPGRHLLG
ncbi:Gfo/Idh/MocA family oxidoreductase [Hymenobacter cheonanensis]|uniref:Gfo/Idh/MocA family oxidoreductase n=1 Tax=Hymenobacter sp. CA2-7 TaxID=3063993 RepID=UPI0027125B62|nr:Gfo/Idh/MocA family oxidoreductase [Hymenobacter sp. CA2-7]MDO7883986.1 Gfo/Idh/MocA family oxidoreductase [Hymenobacter sp. CA2-7]